MKLLTFLALTSLLCLCSVGAGADRFFFPASPKEIRTERYVDASIADAWAAWTTSAGFTAFLGVPATIEPVPGGKFEVLFMPDAPAGERGSEGCTVLSTLPNRMVSFTWNAPPTFPSVRNGGFKTMVVVEFFPAGAARTRVVLHHHGWPAEGESTADWDGTFEYFQKAWPNVLAAMASHFAEKNAAPGNSAGTPPDPKNGFLYTFVELKRPDLLSTTTDEEKKQFGAHANYIKGLTANGTVVFAGPCLDMKGPAVIVLDVRTEQAARELMENDPAVKHGLMKANLHPVRLSFERWRD